MRLAMRPKFCDKNASRTAIKGKKNKKKLSYTDDAILP